MIFGVLNCGMTDRLWGGGTATGRCGVVVMKDSYFRENCGLLWAFTLVS